MKLFSIAFLLFVALAPAHAQSAVRFPEPIGFVSDFESDFSKDELKLLNEAVKELLSRSMETDTLRAMEVAVITVTDSMYGDEKDMSAYATKIGDKWGVGNKAPHQGIIIAYSRKVNKVAIVTGHGLDRMLPAEVCFKMISERMAPYFRKGKPYEAVLAAVNGIRDYLGFTFK